MNRLRSFLILLLVFTLLNQVYTLNENEKDDSDSENDISGIHSNIGFRGSKIRGDINADIPPDWDYA